MSFDCFGDCRKWLLFDMLLDMVWFAFATLLSHLWKIVLECNFVNPLCLHMQCAEKKNTFSVPMLSLSSHFLHPDHATVFTDQFIAVGKSRDTAHELASQIWLAVLDNLEENEHTFILLKRLAQEVDVSYPSNFFKKRLSLFFFLVKYQNTWHLLIIK